MDASNSIQDHASGGLGEMISPTTSQNVGIGCEKTIENLNLVASSTPISHSFGSIQNASSSTSISTPSSDLGSFPVSPDGEADNFFSNISHGSSYDREYQIPITGYEILEEQSRFTIFKILVHRLRSGESWHVFRRYTDFHRLRKKLKILFPRIRFNLPPKRWFRNNFDTTFIEGRLTGLQTFINIIIDHKEICQSAPVRQFFCFDDPPGINNNNEEIKMTTCTSLEEVVNMLQHKLKVKETEVELLKGELTLMKLQVAAAFKSVRFSGSSSPTDSNEETIAKAGQFFTLSHSLLDLVEKSKSTSVVSRRSASLSCSSPDLRKRRKNGPDETKVQEK